MDIWIGILIVRWIYGQIYGYMDGSMDIWMVRWINGWIYRYMDVRWLDGYMDGYLDIWVVRWIYGWLYGWIYEDGSIDLWMGEWTMLIHAVSAASNDNLGCGDLLTFTHLVAITELCKTVKCVLSYPKCRKYDFDLFF